MDEKYICYHHNDGDGWASAAIVKHAIPNVELVEVNYGDKINTNNFIGKHLIIVDFSFPEELMRGTLDGVKSGLVDSFTWIDHHNTAKEKMLDLWNNPEILGMRDTQISACWLTWEYYFHGHIQPDTIKYINDWDTWKFTHGDETKQFYAGLYNNIDGPISDKWAILFNANIDLTLKSSLEEQKMVIQFMKEGNVLLQAQHKRIEKSFECGYEIMFHGHKTWVVNTNHDVSQLGDYICKEKHYPIAMIWSLRKEKTIVSLRSNTVDVGEIAKLYGGGGHKSASGYISNGKHLI